MLNVIGEGKKYDWIVASHVIEHTPDILGFLIDCQELLSPGGRLVLEIPHRRFCFDALRPLTSLGQAFHAHFEKRTRHLPGTIYDFVSEYSPRDSVGAWGEGHPGQLARGHSDATAWAAFGASSTNDDYADTHAQVFVPASFQLLIETVYGLGLLKLREVGFHKPVGCGFFLALSEHGARPRMSSAGRRKRNSLPGCWSASISCLIASEQARQMRQVARR